MSCSISRIAWSAARRRKQRDDVRCLFRPHARRAVRRAAAPTGFVASAIAMSQCAPFAVRQIGRGHVGALGQSGSGEGVARGGVPFRIAIGGAEKGRKPRSRCLCREPAVFEGGERREDVRMLERPRQPVPRNAIRGPAADVLAAQMDRPGRRLELTRQEIRQRRLACAVRADYRMDGTSCASASST